MVVVGYGYAGAVAAIEAHDAGADVLLIEKMPDPGGISITSGGNVRIVEDAEEGFRHLQATNARDHAGFRAAGAGGRDEGDPRLFREACTRVRGDGRSAAGRRQLPFPGTKTFGYVSIEHVPGLRRRAHLSVCLELCPHPSRGGRAPVQGARGQYSLPPAAGHAVNAGAPVDHRGRRRDPGRRGRA